MGGKVRNFSDIVHNFCVQIWVGRLGGEGNLVNDDKYRVFFSGTTPYRKNVYFQFIFFSQILVAIQDLFTKSCLCCKILCAFKISSIVNRLWTMFKFDKFKIFSSGITILQISPFHKSTCFNNFKMMHLFCWSYLKISFYSRGHFLIIFSHLSAPIKVFILKLI